jgi:phage FluMu protein Com
MTEFFHCSSCNKVTSLREPTEKRCPMCDSTNGEVISAQRFKEGFEAGVFFNANPRTGKRSKKKRG